ncbi:High-affinity branched-chain amino acid transport ATP-binding protein LivF [bacterium HR39]|nr:High-affinity branched-chain amino acid transport ATP-binding protein LivF [bacterium HR39]
MSALLEVEGLVVRYGRATVVHGISFALERGGVLALLGRNGAGKTTTLRAVMGLVPPAAGRIRPDGRDIAGLPPSRIARTGVGWVPEDRRIFRRLTVLENLEVGRQPARDRGNPWTVERLFALFPQLAERRHHRGHELSGGEQQMLAIARALRGNPELLLLDEPSEGLAPPVVRTLFEALGEARAQGLTLLLSEQNFRFARLLADRACILESGTLRFSGPMRELEERPELARAHLAV